MAEAQPNPSSGGAGTPGQRLSDRETFVRLKTCDQSQNGSPRLPTLRVLEFMECGGKLPHSVSRARFGLVKSPRQSQT